MAVVAERLLQSEVREMGWFMRSQSKESDFTEWLWKFSKQDNDPIWLWFLEDQSVFSVEDDCKWTR